MRIGITFYADQPLSYEVNQTAFVLAELFAVLEHDIVLVHQSSTILHNNSSYAISEIGSVSMLDWLIDIDGHFLPTIRNQAATRTIVFLRTFLQFEEMNASVYADYPYQPRYVQDAFEIWCWDVLNPEETIPSIQTLFSCPIRRVPFIWAPIHSSITSTYQKEEPWTVHVSEEHTNTSSIIIPLCAIRELTTTYKIPATYQIHGADAVKENRYFKENILHNIEADSLPLVWTNKVEWSGQNPNSMVLSHSRFILLRPCLLPFIWHNVPLIHNSPVIADLHPLLKSLYYTKNSIQELCVAVTRLLEDPEPWYASQQEIRTALMRRFGIEAHQSAWKQIMDSLPVSSVLPVSGSIRIAFANMWEGFNYNSNFIVDALRNHSSLSISGLPYSMDCEASLVICGPHGQPVSIPHSIPKVYWSAENWPVPHDPSYAFYLTNSLEEDNKHLRIPTWMIFIDWFTKEIGIPTNCTDNPIRFPLSMAMQPHAIPFQERKDFCGFVVSNPTCTLRNEAFHYVNNYKKVNSGGALYNNIGGQLALKYPGGGCGDISKYHFFSTHQFTLSFENSQSPGYITEKLLHAKMAGCVPLYWGSMVTDNDFVSNSFINVSAISSAESVVDVIKKLESRPDLCATIASTPILDTIRKQKALDQMSKMSQKLLALASTHVTMLQRIDRAFVVNLDSRPDRWNSLMVAEPVLEQMVTRISAVHGKTLKLTRDIYKRYKNNPFKWKKAIIGCYMSHIKIWKQIVEEAGDYFLVLEDDVRFEHEWMTQWNRAATCIPADAELLYWGGVLPPNKMGLSSVLESVNDCWASIRPNTLCNKTPLPVFHFCTYSYVITKAGAKKLLHFIESLDGMPYSGCDHLLGRAGLQTYVATPLLAKCAQEDDPSYIYSQFNDLHREDQFDSDIWNNNDCFSIQDLTPFFSESAITLYYLSTDKDFQLYERTWLEDMFQCTIDCKPFTSLEEAEEGAWFFIQRPHSMLWKGIFSHAVKSFRILHLSDEFLSDDISMYMNPLCKGVIRNYKRNDVPDAPHILTIPLGYHYRHGEPYKHMEKRKWVWSFHGTDWYDRSQQLAAFQAYHPYSCRLQPDWNHPSGTKEDEYLDALGNSAFCPILKGNNMETFRLYEALEAGTLPLFGPSISSDFLAWVQQHINLSAWYDWTNIESMNLSNEIKIKAQADMMAQWAQWKMEIQKACRAII
jgi:alpha(1,3/1,4) fucosyltransferase